MLFIPVWARWTKKKNERRCVRKGQPAVGCGIRSVALNKRLTQGLRDRRKRARAYPLHNKASYKWARSVFLTGCNKHSPQTNAPLLQPASSNRFSGAPPAHLTAASEPPQKPFGVLGSPRAFLSKSTWLTGILTCITISILTGSPQALV